MYQMVIYTDGTSGIVKPSRVNELASNGEIIAFLGPNGWLEARRKNKSRYDHVDRRHTKPEDFFERFYF